jgi:hypothetical protein
MGPGWGSQKGGLSRNTVLEMSFSLPDLDIPQATDTPPTALLRVLYVLTKQAKDEANLLTPNRRDT